MANFTAVVTTAGLALLDAVSNAGGTLVLTNAKAGSGVLGATDPLTLTDLIATVQTSSVVDAREGTDGWVMYSEFSNAALVAGYTRTEMGIFAQRQGHDDSETLLVYLYAIVGEADYIPANTGIPVQTPLDIKVGLTAGMDVTITIDQDTVYLPIARFTQHLAGAGGTDQHPVATALIAGLMSAAQATTLHNVDEGLYGHVHAVLDDVHPVQRGYRAQTVRGSAPVTLAAFNAATVWDMGVTPSQGGAVSFSENTPGAVSWLFSMVITVASSTTVTFQIMNNDDILRLYVDGAEKYYSSTTTQTLRQQAVTLAVGTHIVQALVANNGGGSLVFTMGPWFAGVANVAFLRAATS